MILPANLTLGTKYKVKLQVYIAIPSLLPSSVTGRVYVFV